MAHTLTVTPNSVFTGQNITINVDGLIVDEEQPWDGEHYDYSILRDGALIYGYDPDAGMGHQVIIGPVSITCQAAWLAGDDDVLLTVRVYVFSESVIQLEQTVRLRRGGQVIPYTIDEDVAKLPASGWLPKDTRRNNLYRLMLAYGLNIIKGPDGNPHFTALRASEAEEIDTDGIFMGGSVEHVRPYAAVSVLEHTYTALTDANSVTLYDNTRDETPAVNKEVWFTQAPVIVETLTATAGLSIVIATENSAIVTGQGVLTGVPYTHTTQAAQREKTGGERGKTASVNDNTMVSIINGDNLVNRLFAFYCADHGIERIRTDLVYDRQRCGKIYRFQNPFGEEKTAFLSSSDLNASSFVRGACELIAGYVPAGQEGLYTHVDDPTSPDFKLTVIPKKGRPGELFSARITGHGQEAMTVTVRSVSTGNTLASYSIQAPASEEAVTQAIMSADGWLSAGEKVGIFQAQAETMTTHRMASDAFFLYAEGVNPDDIDPDDPNPPRDPKHLYVRVVPARGMPGDELTAYAGGHNGTAVSAVIKNSSLTTVASFAAVTPAGSKAEVSFDITLNSDWFSSTDGIEEDMFIVATSGDGQTATARFKMLAEEGDWTVPDGVTSIKVVLIGGGKGGASGFPGEAGKTTTPHTNVAEDTDISGMWYGAEGGDGGKGGDGGAPGRVKTVTLEVTPGTTYHWRRGRGGAGGAATDPAAEGEEAVSNPGSAGTASTFGISGGTVYSSDDADAHVPTAGVYDPINGAWYALRGSAGIRGGKGGARKIEADGYFAWTTDGEDVTGPDGTVYHGGKTGTPMTAVDGLPECRLTAYGGNGAGAAVGLDREDHPEMDGQSDQEASWEVVENGV